MIAINKAEKEAVVKRFPYVTIVRTMVGRSGRHHYYCEESKAVIDFLNDSKNIYCADARRDNALNNNND